MVFKEVRGLHQAAYVLAIFTFGSQLLALIRDRLLAQTFGASAELDLYYAAFKIPDLLFVLFASTLSVYVLIPFVARRRDGDDHSSARLLLGQVFTVFLGVYITLAIVIGLFIPYIIPYVFPGLVAQSETLTLLIRILLLQPLFLGISSLYGVVTQLSHRFVLFAVSPLIYNVGIIIGILLLYPWYGLSGLVWGVVIGAVGHMLVQVPFVRKSELRFGLRKRIAISELGEILSISLPRALTLSLNQITLLFLVGYASILTVGSVSVFQFAYNLHSVPLAIIGVSYSVAAFPILAELVAKQDFVSVRLHINSALRHIIFWSAPAIVLIIVLRAQIVRVVLGAGAFNWDDTRLTAALLAVLSLSLVAQAVNLLFIRALYAGGYTRSPLFIAVFGLVVAGGSAYAGHHLYGSSEGFRLTIEYLFRVRGVPGTEALVVAGAFLVSVLAQTLLLGLMIKKAFSLPFAWLPSRLLKSIVASVVGGAVVYVVINIVALGINETTFIGIMIQGAIGGTFGILTIGLMYYLLNMPEYFEVRDTIHRRFFSTPTIRGGGEENV